MTSEIPEIRVWNMTIIRKGDPLYVSPLVAGAQLAAFKEG